MELLTKEKVEEALTSLNGWSFKDNGIVKNFVFEDFKEALTIMMGIGIIAEEMNHHPEWFNVYNRLDVTLATHDANGVTSYDLELAKFIDDVAAS